MTALHTKGKWSSWLIGEQNQFRLYCWQKAFVDTLWEIFACCLPISTTASVSAQKNFLSPINSNTFHQLLFSFQWVCWMLVSHWLQPPACSGQLHVEQEFCQNTSPLHHPSTNLSSGCSWRKVIGSYLECARVTIYKICIGNQDLPPMNKRVLVEMVGGQGVKTIFIGIITINVDNVTSIWWM